MVEFEDLFSDVDYAHLLKHLGSTNTDSLRHAATIINEKIEDTIKLNPVAQIDPKMSLLVLVYSANIDYSKKECDEVVKTIATFAKSTRDTDEGVAQHLIQGRGFDLEKTARKCFYMTTFTPERISYRESRRGAPNLTFYERIGKGAYYELGHRELPYHFGEWREHFKSRKFAQPPKSLFEDDSTSN